MSGVAQRGKGLKHKGLTCGNGSRFDNIEAAKAFIQKLKNKDQRGAKTLQAYKCRVCSNRQGDVIHVGRMRSNR